MAIFSTKFSAVKRSQGQNAVSSAAYISRSKMTLNTIENSSGIQVNIDYNYVSNKELIHSKILAPAGAPAWVYDREKLWNMAEDAEKRKDAQVALKYMFALPKELSLEQNLELAEQFANEYLVSQGMIVDYSVHYDKPDNPHIHFQMTTRNLNGENFDIKKNSQWSKKPFLKYLNQGVADTINHHLELYGHLDRVSHLSFKERGIELKSSVHEGPARYIKNSELIEKNKKILLENSKRIAENPELVLDKLSINKPVFTKEDIAKVLNEVISHNLTECKANQNFEELNSLMQQEFLTTYATVMSSEKLTLIVREDLKSRTLYGLTKRLELEKRFEETVHDLNETTTHKFNEKDIKLSAASHLSEEQRRVITEILSGSNISVLEGLPGAGKTTVMREVVTHYQTMGKRVIGAAPSSVAALNLASVTGIEAKNLTQWRKIWQEDAGQKFDLNLKADYFSQEQYQHGHSLLTSNDVIIIDEAGMVELSNMDYALQEAAKVGAKVILVGDNNQLSAIGMGGAFKKASSIAKASKLTEVRRQKNTEHAKVSQLLGDYKITEALNILKEQNCFKIANTHKIARDLLVKDYIGSYLSKNQQSEKTGKLPGNDRLLVIAAYTNKTVDLLNKQVRTALKDSGIIKGAGKNINLGNKNIELNIGEQIVFLQNNSKLNILNGEVATILSIDDKNKLAPIIKTRVIKGDGSTHNVSIDIINDKYHYIDYGYALNAHKLQGITVDETYLYYEKEIGYEAFNVLATRHREKLTIYAVENILNEQITSKLNFNKDSAKYIKSLEANSNQPTAWLTGFEIGISRRSNLNFASDYKSGEAKDIFLNTNDQTLKDYIDAKTKTFNYIREINEWAIKSTESQNATTRPQLWEHELWKQYIQTKNDRNKAASKIVNNYHEFADRIIQLNLNYTTIREHAGDKSLKYNVKYNNEYSTIAGSEHYIKVIKDLIMLTQRLNSGEKIAAIDSKSFIRSFKNNHRELQHKLAELKANIVECDRQLNQALETKYNLEDHVLSSQTYRTELFPNYLSTIYSASPEEIINNWHNLKSKVGIDAALTQVKVKPEILNPKLFSIGSLKGTGFGTALGFDSTRSGAISNSKVLEERFKKYENSFIIEEKAKAELTAKNIDKIEEEAIMTKAKLQQELPSKHESNFIELASKAVSKRSLKALTELANSYEARNAIVEYNNSHNKTAKTTTAEVDISKNQKEIFENDSRKPSAVLSQEAANTLYKLKGEFALSYTEVKAYLSSMHYEQIFRNFAANINPDGKIIKRGSNINCGSLGMNLKNGQWHRFSTGQSGDIFKLVSEAGYSKRNALEIVAECAGITKNMLDKTVMKNHIDNSNFKSNIVTAEPRDEWLAHNIVPIYAPALDFQKHMNFILRENSLEGIYEYKNIKGDLLGYTVRLKNIIDGCKQILPVGYCYNKALGENSSKWRFKGFSDEGSKPLYGAHKINQDRKPILIVEGEKTADIAQKQLPEYSVLSWLGGSNGASKANWNLLKDREVVIWPDNDLPSMYAANEIANRINVANGFKGMVSTVNPQNIKFSENEHKNIFEKGWDLGDLLPRSLSYDDIREVLSNVRDEAKTINETINVEVKLDSILKSDVAANANIALRNNAYNVLWQNKATGSLALSPTEIIEQAKVITEHQEKISSHDLVHYMKYAKARGILDNAHEFLDVEHGLCKSALTHIFLNSMQNDAKEKIFDTDALRSSKFIAKDKVAELQNEYLRKIKDVHVNLDVSNKYLKSLNNPNKQELFKILCRDVALIHNESIKCKLTMTHQDKICDTVVETIKEHKFDIPNNVSTNNHKFDILDKIAIAENLYQKVNSKEWWKELALKNSSITHEKLGSKNQNIDKLLQNNIEKINDIKALSPEFNLKSFGETLSTLSDNDRIKAINSLWSKTFKKSVFSQIEQIRLDKNKAKTVDEIITVMNKEREVCRDLFNNYNKLSSQFRQHEKNDYIHKVHDAHFKSPELLNNIHSDANYIEQNKLWAPGKTLNELKNANYLNNVAKTLFRECQEHVLKQTTKILSEFGRTSNIEHNGKLFVNKESFLEYCFNKNSNIAKYFAGTKIEEHYKHIQSQQIQNKQTQSNKAIDIQFKL